MAATSGITALQKIALGEESDPGTGVTATILWRGTGSMKDTRKIVEVGENVGMHAPQDNTYTAQLGGEITLEQALAFEQFKMVLNAGYAMSSAVADGAGSGKIWTASMPHAASTAVPTKTYSFHGGSTNGSATWAETAYYGFVSEYSIKGTPGDLLQLSSTWLTREVANSGGFPSASPAAVHLCPFGGATLYIDAYSGTIGSTAKSNSVIGYDFNVKTGLVPAYTADRLDFSIVKYTRPEVTLKITFEMNGTANTEKQTHWRSQNTRQIRLKHVGAALTSAGTTYTYYTLIYDIVGRWVTFDVIDSQDGDDIVTGEFKGMYNSTAALYHRVIVVDESATIP